MDFLALPDADRRWLYALCDHLDDELATRGLSAENFLAAYGLMSGRTTPPDRRPPKPIPPGSSETTIRR